MDDLSSIRQENNYLLERFERGQIYTWVGTLLLVINPNGEISTCPNLLHTHNPYDKICDVTRKEVAPHICAVATRAHYRIVEGLGKPDQVIVLNGETGTGKTFNARKALEFLIARNASADKHRGRDVACNIVQRITDACRLMSAFTVASTERNEVSSRHVELVWLEYKMGSICGAMVSSYLLERNRVTMGRCNFQIFGQMMTALMNIDEFADTGLSKDRQYFMSSDLDSSKEQQLRDGCRDTLRAMDILGFTKDQKKDIFQVLSLLIHMGNIRFTQEDDHCRIDTDDQQSKEALENTCKLAGLQKEDFAELLTSTLINPQSFWQRHIIYRRNLNTKEACRYRLHSIIRHLYDLLFHWLIDSVNRILSARLFNERLGILDVFGFERFHANGIEQLCINYINERFQQYFMEKHMEFRRRTLQEEDLVEDMKSLDIARYEDRLNTIEKHLFSTLNDVCLSTVPSDASKLIQQVCANGCPKTKQFLKVRNENLIIQHYAGAVEYSFNDLLFKNLDKIPDEIAVTFGASKNNTFLYRLVNKSKLHHENGRAKKPTILSKLRHNVNSLTQELDKCDVHYVRCIKPRRLDSREWDRNELRRQLANTGIFDALPLARCKYSIHFSYKEFFKRYYYKRTSFRIRFNMLKSHLTVNGNDLSVYYGKHFIFLTEHTFLHLESARKQFHVECVRKIEFFWIKYRDNRRQNVKENTTANDQTIDIKNELMEKSHLERIISMGINVYAETYWQNTRRNTACDDQAVVNIQDRSTKKNKLENKYHVQLIDYSITQEKHPFMPNVSYDKTTYIIHWLKDVSKAMNKKKSKQLSISHNQLVDIQSQDVRHTKRSNNNKLYTENRHENNPEDYNKKDVHVIRYGTFTLFYKNGVLSRCRPARLPVRVHTRLTCLTNSHCLVHTELPLGLQDCL
ncbi:uncharacterized protein [Anoplolepis gracilipes]|uniref:uncharacterized protein isoform X2 n=1 Tax=Anoplolepis gracilipes TaxID=354296 RepID=UPI003BA197EA